jgi:hypothetical protein
MIPSFNEPIWLILKILLLLIFGGMVALIIHFWRLARKRDKEKKQSAKKAGE